VQTSDKTKKVLARVEPVEWLYDGLKGKIIPWTMEHGNKSHDPSCLAFLVGRDGKVVSKCPGGQAYSASGFSKWLSAEVDKYERAHPRTRVPFVVAEPDEFESAREARKPVLLYFGRDSFDKKDSNAKKQAKACRKFEKGTLHSKKAAEQAKAGKWVLLRYDLANKEHAAFAKRLGVAEAPVLVMFPAGAEKPEIFAGAKLKGPNLAYHLKRARAPK
jgi:hypothetical protein